MFLQFKAAGSEKEIQYHWNEIQLKKIASFPRFQFSFESKFRYRFSVVILSFYFSLLSKRKKKKRKSDILLTSQFLHCILFLKKRKKKKRKKNKTKQKPKNQKTLDTIPTFHFDGLFKLVSQGCRKSEKHLTNLWHEGER